jgi:hypothetical protein
MKDRIFKNWTFIRGLYTVLGIYIIAQSIMDKQWIGLVFGGYFASMGIFAFGCAAGNCFNVNSTPKSTLNNNEIKYEEIK